MKCADAEKVDRLNMTIIKMFYFLRCVSMNGIKERETLALSRFSEIKAIIVSSVQALKHMAPVVALHS